HSSVEARRNFSGNRHSRLPSQAIDHFGGRAGMRIYPIDIGKRPARRVVINVDEKVAIEASNTGPLHAVTFQDDGGLKTVSDLAGLDNGIRERQRTVYNRNRIVHNHLRLLPQLAQDL